MDMRVKGHFDGSAVSGRDASFEEAYDSLLAGIAHYTQNKTIDEAEPEIRDAFFHFLHTQKLSLSTKNFEKLLAEKSGDKLLRNDGTVGWYHEFLPVIFALSLVKIGKDKGGIYEPDLATYGGLDVMISTELRHDSVEDNIKKETLRRQMARASNDDANGFDKEEEMHKARMIVRNVDLMSQRKLFDKNGAPVIDRKTGKQDKEDSRLYVYRMVKAEASNPIVFMNKQMDVIQNLSTMFGAPKFTAQKRKLKCNSIEDKFGWRHQFPRGAKKRWPEFRNAIDTLDRTMGVLVYFNFRYLEYVDLAYKEKEKQPIDILTFAEDLLKGAFRFDLPENLHPVHVFMKRMMASVDPFEEPKKYDRLQSFIEKVIKPSLEGFEDKFPYIFDAPMPKNAPKPAASLAL